MNNKSSIPAANISEKKLVATINKGLGTRHKLAVKVEKLKKSYELLEKKVIECADKLKNSRETLEQKVLDRTQSLENANIAVQNILEDLSEEKTKSEVARAKEEAILSSIGEGLMACDEKGNIILMNKSAEELLRQKASESIGRLFYDITIIENDKGEAIPLAKRPLSLALSGKIITTVSVVDSTYYYVREDKTRFPVAITVTPIILDGKVIGAIDAFHDITHDKAVDKAKSEFVSFASHQLRTPLTATSWDIEMLMNGNLGQVTPKQKEYLEKIYEGNRKMVEMINNFLNVSRIELGALKNEPRQINIAELIQSVIEEQTPKILDKKIVVTKKISENIPKFQSDPQMIRMVFQNLLSNAIKYTPNYGQIKLVASFEVNKNILVKISDTGIGIPDDQKDKIFTKLFRADNVKSKGTEGTGLGLYIVKSIIDINGGKVWFDSKEDKGSTFYVTLPLI